MRVTQPSLPVTDASDGSPVVAPHVVRADDADNVVLRVEGAEGQTANLQEWGIEGDDPLVSVNAAGWLTIPVVTADVGVAVSDFNFALLIHGTLGQMLAFDTNDYIAYDRDEDIMRFSVGPDKESTLTAGAFILSSGTGIVAGEKVYPGTPAGAQQQATGIYAGTGAPSNSDGSNGDFYLRSDGAALTTIYQKRAGAWVGIV